MHYRRAGRSGHPARARWWTVVKVVLAIAAVLAWAVYLRPPVLGGRAAFIPVKGISMTPTLHSGDLVLLRESSSYHTGQIIAFDVPKGQPDAGKRVIHRIVSGSDAEGFVTKGDYNKVNDAWTVPRSAVIGRYELRIPWLGRSVTSIHVVGLAAVATSWLLLMVVATWRVYSAARDETDHPEDTDDDDTQPPPVLEDDSAADDGVERQRETSRRLPVAVVGAAVTAGVLRHAFGKRSGARSGRS
jgi:signal peptidase